MRGPASATTASCAHQRDRQNASVAPSVAAAIETGVPRAVPNSSPLVAARIGPGNSTTVRHAETAMNTNGAAAPWTSSQPRTRAADSEPEKANSATKAASVTASSASRSTAARRLGAGAAGGPGGAGVVGPAGGAGADGRV